MKRKIMLLTITAFLLTVIGCSNPQTISAPTEEHKVQLYKVEFGIITNQTYKAAMNTESSWTELSYSKFASLRNYLYNNTISGYEVTTGVTLNEIKEFLLQHSASNYETECIIKSLKEVGNCICFFSCVYGDDKKVWAYATK